MRGAFVRTWPRASCTSTSRPPRPGAITPEIRCWAARLAGSSTAPGSVSTLADIPAEPCSSSANRRPSGKVPASCPPRAGTAPAPVSSTLATAPPAHNVNDRGRSFAEAGEAGVARSTGASVEASTERPRAGPSSDATSPGAAAHTRGHTMIARADVKPETNTRLHTTRAPKVMTGAWRLVPRVISASAKTREKCRTMRGQAQRPGTSSGREGPSARSSCRWPRSAPPRSSIARARAST